VKGKGLLCDSLTEVRSASARGRAQAVDQLLAFRVHGLNKWSKRKGPWRIRRQLNRPGCATPDVAITRDMFNMQCGSHVRNGAL